MKQLFVIMGVFFLFGCNSKNRLPQDDIDLLTKLNFDVEIFADIKSSLDSNLKQLPAIDKETGEVLSEKYAGVYAPMVEERAIELVKANKEKFRSRGYLIFMMEGENDSRILSVIKGTDELDILRYRRTDGINYGLTNADVVSKIAEWKDKYGIVVLGCSRDWLQIEFNRLPANLDEFADEVYKFCPDSVDQGVGDVSALKLAIQEMNGLWLWWD